MDPLVKGPVAPPNSPATQTRFLLLKVDPKAWKVHLTHQL